ncbi:hypothetical protein DSO57_1028582 [Entomophthora muscae]|uniref:Uncharacterized protein n=1 Tax=Entomophthora muscae TaxID=34485 RepID=A0ACC2RSK3_9FUNG|nr:hypothetical protein DSO57_1028582 [Entomophthora muscae]
MVGGVLMLLWWAANVVYSLLFSPLRHLPSPAIFQLCPLYYQYLAARGDAPFRLLHYHLCYGKVFRIGWNYVVFVDGAACQTLYATYSFEKSSAFYKIFAQFGDSIFSTSSRSLHSFRKKAVAPALTRTAVFNMEDKIRDVGVVPLMRKMGQTEQADIYHLFHFMSWDTMLQIIAGHNLNMLEYGNHPVADWISATLGFNMLCYLFPPCQLLPPKLRQASSHHVHRHPQYLLCHT